MSLFFLQDMGKACKNYQAERSEKLPCFPICDQMSFQKIDLLCALVID
jgi:CRISPR/Cas system-associated endonuclease Cas3-HD